MELTKKGHKAMLLSFFFIRDALGQIQEKKFPLDELVAASGCMKKLKENGVLDEANGMISFDDSPVEFDRSEERTLAKLVEGVKEASATEAADLLELKELFK